jgi:hypothetical protein
VEKESKDVLYQQNESGRMKARLKNKYDMYKQAQIQWTPPRLDDVTIVYVTCIVNGIAASK